MKCKYKYLVAFAYKNGQGSVVINSRNKINSDGRVIGTTEHIQERLNLENVAITNIVLLDKEWGFGEWLVAIAELSLLVFCILSMIAAIFG